MKKWFLLWISLLLGYKSFASPYLAHFDNYGKIEVTKNPRGLRIDIELQAQPMEKYMIKLLSSCEPTSPYWVQFRHSFKIITVSDKNGTILKISYFPGMHDRDLISRQLNTAALTS